MPIVDCDRNAGIVVTDERQCPHYYYTDANQNMVMDLPVIRLTQNGKHLFTASMSAAKILSMSVVPALRWSTDDYESFCTDTHNAVVAQAAAAGARPTLWQRPLDMGRELDIRDYYYNGAAREPESLIPGSVVLGELDNNDPLAPHTAVVEPTALVGGVQYYNLHIEWTLRNNCPCGWVPPNGDPFFDRCGNHSLVAAPAGAVWTPCPNGNHGTSTNPLQIIDGQHRTLGIMKAGPNEEIPVVFMLRNKQQVENPPGNVTSIAVAGTTGSTQAKIFEKVNNTAKGLHPSHILWIERLLTPGAGLDPDEEAAFDLAAQLGHAPAGGVVGHGPWQNMISFQPTKAGQVHSNSNSLVTMNGGALTGILPILDVYRRAGYGSRIEQLTHFLNGACVHSPAGVNPEARPMFYGPNTKPFRSERMFTGVLRSYEHIASWAIYLGGGAAGCLNHDNFTDAWNLHTDTWTAPNLDNWKKLQKTSEGSAPHIDRIHSLMWPDPPALPAPLGTVPPTSPPWDTKNPCANWTDYANMAPDPIRLITPGTRRSLDSVWNARSDDNSICDGTCGKKCICKKAGTCDNCLCLAGGAPPHCSGPRINDIPTAGMNVITWEGPRNILPASTQILIREFDNATGEFKTPIDPVEMMVDIATAAAAVAGLGVAATRAAVAAAKAAAFTVVGFNHTLTFDVIGRGLVAGDPLRVEITDLNLHGSTECILEFELI